MKVYNYIANRGEADSAIDISCFVQRPASFSEIIVGMLCYSKYYIVATNHLAFSSHNRIADLSVIKVVNLWSRLDWIC